jgi:hypothetical protein
MFARVQASSENFRDDIFIPGKKDFVTKSIFSIFQVYYCFTDKQKQQKIQTDKDKKSGLDLICLHWLTVPESSVVHVMKGE